MRSRVDGEQTAGMRVELEHVRRAYRTGKGATVTAVDDVSLDLPAGSAVALTGTSGAGKSTLLHLLGAMDRPDAGRVVVDGVDLAGANRRGLAEHRRQVGFVFQRFHLLPALSVLDNVRAPLVPYRVPFDKRARAQEVIEAVGLAGRERELPSELSGGQQQRVAVARALVNHPRLLLADEPTGNLDSRTGTEIVDLIMDLRERSGMTVVVATHDPALAARCDRVVRLRDGAVVDDTVVPDGDSGPSLTSLAGYRPS